MEQHQHERLSKYRSGIDEIDDEIIVLLGKRFDITYKVGLLKAEFTLPPQDKLRENKQKIRLRNLAEKNKINPDFVEKLLQLIQQEVIKNHKQIYKENIS